MESFSLIIFGITSNLASLKVLPALYDMEEKHLLPEKLTIVGIARSPKSGSQLRDYLLDSISKERSANAQPIDQSVFERLLARCHYFPGDTTHSDFYPKLKTYLDSFSHKQSEHNRIFYLATYPNLYQTIFENLKLVGLNEENTGFVRLMIEKPIGHDLASAKVLNTLLHQYFSEEQIYRLDHYLGKETVQNILTFRFGNGIFEPLINPHYVDHIQITSAEEFGIGKRGGYYDSVGALKDVGQNHLLQLLTFATMDAPEEFSNEAVTKERTKILQNITAFPQSLVLGQYDGYQQEEHVRESSEVNTFFAFKTEINNDRFKGIPIYIRGGKKLAKTITEVAIVFKIPLNRLFAHLECGEEPNVLIYRIQPNEGIVLKILAKVPGHTHELEPTYMQFTYNQSSKFKNLPDPYERLLFDAFRGDQTFFNDAAEVEAQWAFIDALSLEAKKPLPYSPGSWGPTQAEELIQKDNRSWIDPSIEFD